MCSVDPDELTEMIKATDGLDISGGDVICRKCKESIAKIVLRRKDAYCRECFLYYFEHKFRSTIGKSKQITHGDQVLVAVSGGASSTALIHLIRSGLNENSHKKLRFEPTYLYVDESSLSGGSFNLESIEKVCDNVVSLDFPCYMTSLEQVMASDLPAIESYTKGWQAKIHQNESYKTQLFDLISSCKTTSTQQDLHQQLRLSLILQCAQVLGFKKVFLGDNATTLSIRILSEVALGRGSHLQNQVHFKSVREDVEIYRPMREILENEVLYYLQLHNLVTTEPSSPQSLVQNTGTSILGCTEKFVKGLQKDFPATIPTIFRTGDKLVCVSQDTDKSSCSDFPHVNGESDTCVLCGCDLDTDRGDASALRATQVSQNLIHKASLKETQHNSEVKDTDNTEEGNKNGEESLQNGVPTKCSSDTQTKESDSCSCGRISGCCSVDQTAAIKNKDHLTQEIIENHLCYGCRILVRDMNAVDHLPVKVHKTVTERENRRHMREQIQDFLL